MLLRRELPLDQSAVRAVHNAAFGGAADTAEARLVDDLRADDFQVRPLTAWDDSLRGTFRYARAFDRLS